MVSFHTLTIKITSQKDESEESFLARVEPRLTCLSDLKGSFDRRGDNILARHDRVLYDGYERWSLTVAVGVSVGRERGIFLHRLYQAILRLIELELPDCSVEGQQSVWKPS